MLKVLIYILNFSELFRLQSLNRELLSFDNVLFTLINNYNLAPRHGNLAKPTVPYDRTFIYQLRSTKFQIF